MSNYKNPHLKENEKRYNFVPHLKFKKVKHISRTRFRQQLGASLTYLELLASRDTNPLIN